MVRFFSFDMDKMILILMIIPSAFSHRFQYYYSPSYRISRGVSIYSQSSTVHTSHRIFLTSYSKIRISFGCYYLVHFLTNNVYLSRFLTIASVSESLFFNDDLRTELTPHTIYPCTE